MALGIVLLVSMLAGIGIGPATPIPGPALVWGTVALALLTLSNLAFGSTLRDIHVWTENKCLTWLLKLEAKTTGVELSEFETDDPNAAI